MFWVILPLNLLFIFYYFYAISIENEGMFYSYIRLFYNYIPVLITISPFLINQIITYNKWKKTQLNVYKEMNKKEIIHMIENKKLQIDIKIAKILRKEIINSKKIEF